MLIFGLITLALLFYAVAIALAFLYFRREVRSSLQSQARLGRVRNKAQMAAIAAAVKEFREETEGIKVQLLNIPDSKKDPFSRATAGLLSKTEDRYVEDFNRAMKVTVEGIPDQGKAA